MSHVAYLSLGSNLGDRAANLRESIAQLSSLGEVLKISSLYQTEPVDLREQPWFLNCIVELRTDLEAQDLLTRIQVIEASLGRKREISKGPRTIDIDIVLFNSSVIRHAHLGIPHPRMHERRFVLAPLAELAPNMVHPTLKKSIQQLLRELPDARGKVDRLANR